VTLAYREAVLAALVTALRGLSGVTVYRQRGKAVKERPALNVLDGGHAEPLCLTGQTEYRLSVEIEAHVGAAKDEDLGPAASELYARVVETLTADPSLGGLVTDVAEGAMTPLDHAEAEGAAAAAVFVLEFTVTFATAERNPRSGA